MFSLLAADFLRQLNNHNLAYYIYNVLVFKLSYDIFFVQGKVGGSDLIGHFAEVIWHLNKWLISGE